MYWATQTLFGVGFGDVVAITNVEAVVSMITMVVASVQFAFIIGHVRFIQALRPLLHSFHLRCTASLLHARSLLWLSIAACHSYAVLAGAAFPMSCASQSHFVDSSKVYWKKVAATFAYCHRNNVSDELLHRIHNFFEYCHRQRPFVDEQKQLAEMSPTLRSDVILKMHGGAVGHIPVFERHSSLHALHLLTCCCLP